MDMVVMMELEMEVVWMAVLMAVVGEERLED